MCLLTNRNRLPLATEESLSDSSGLPEDFLTNLLCKRKSSDSTDLSSPPVKLQKLAEEKQLINAVRASNRSIEKITALLDSGEDINQTDNFIRNSALHFAAFYNSFPIVKCLTNRGANLNQVNQYGSTPLMSAIEKGHTAIAKFLISAGTDLTIADQQGFTSLHKIILNGNYEILEAFLTKSSECKTFDINAATTQGLTALHQAAYHGNQKAVKCLCEHKASVNAKSHAQTTALHMAATRNQTDIARILISYGAQINQQDAHNRTPLHYACIYGHVDVARFLLRAGADHSLTDFNSKSPRSIALDDEQDELLALFANSHT